MATQIDSYTDQYNDFINYLTDVKNILDEVKNEFNKQSVHLNLTYEDLKAGNFVEIFEKYHKSERDKDQKVPVFEKYLEYYGLKSDKLLALEKRYNIWLEYKTSLYNTNDRFYSFYERNRKTDSNYNEIMARAPKKTNYTLFDFVIIKKDSLSIIVPKEPFNVYATSKQKEVIKTVKEYVSLAKKLNVEHERIEPSIRKYLNKRGGLNKKPGLTKDLTEINFDYNYILTL